MRSRAPVGAVHRQVRVDTAAQPAPVEEAGAQTLGAREALDGARGLPVGAAQRAERGVRPGRQQPVLHSQAAARPAETGRAVAPVQSARAAEEGPAAAPGQPGRMRGCLQHGREELLEEGTRPVPGQPEFGRPGQHRLGRVQELRMVFARQVQPVALPPQQMPYDDRAQHRDPLGVHGDQAAEADVREVPVGEGEPVLGDEGAPVDRAPRGQLHAGDVRGLGRREGALRCPRQQRGGRVGRLAVPPGVRSCSAYSTSTSPVSVSRASSVARAPGARTSSPSRNSRYAPVAACIPVLRAPLSPADGGECTGATRESRRAYPAARAAAGVPGASLTGISSKSPKDWARTESSARDNRPATPWDGTMMLKRGMLLFLCRCGGRSAAEGLRRTVYGGRSVAVGLRRSVSGVFFRRYVRAARPAAGWTAGSGWAVTSRRAWQLP